MTLPTQRARYSRFLLDLRRGRSTSRLDPGTAGRRRSRPEADEPCRDTLTITDSLADSRSRCYAHELRTSQAECRGFESRLPLHCLPLHSFLVLSATLCLPVRRPGLFTGSRRSRATTLGATGFAHPVVGGPELSFGSPGRPPTHLPWLPGPRPAVVSVEAQPARFLGPGAAPRMRGGLGQGRHPRSTDRPPGRRAPRG